MEDGILPPTVVAQGRLAGVSTLPLVVFVYSKSYMLCYGAWLLTECACLEDTSVAYWRVDRQVLYAQPVKLEKKDIAWTSTIVHFTVVKEMELRMLEVAPGGRMMDHMVFDQKRWRAWLVDEAQLQETRRGSTGDPFTICSPLLFCKALGVQPDIARCSGI